MKSCFKCGVSKPLNKFYKHSQMADGHLNKCKECTKKDATETRNLNIDYYREYDRDRSNLPHRIKARKKVAEKWKTDPKLKKRRSVLTKKWIERNKIKRAAHVITGNALRDGKLIKQPCEVCGKKKVEAHHEDYTQPLKINWLCRKHHVELHKEKRENERRSN